MLRRTTWRQNDPLFIKLNNNIRKYSHTIINPSNIDFSSPNIINKSWFSNLIYPYQFPYTCNPIDFSKCEHKPINYRTIKINIFLNKEQKEILKYWFNAFNIMYNETILFLRKHIPYGNIKYLKIYYNNFKKFENNSKTIKTCNNQINKFRAKYDLLQIKLQELFLEENKTHVIHKNITKFKKNISDINYNIKSKNNQINTLLEENKLYSEHRNLYLSLQKHINTFLDYTYIRTNYLKDKRDSIADKFSYESNKSKQIHIHSLDGAIKKACANYKTCIDNLLNNRIKRFRIKCRNLDKANKIVEIDTTSFNFDKDDNCYHICKRILGKLQLKYNNKEYQLTDTAVSTVMYDGFSYTLLKPVPVVKVDVKAKHPFIALDPGVRDFLTGFTNNSIIKYGHNLAPILKKYYNKIDTLNTLNSLKNGTVEEDIGRSMKKFINLAEKNSKLTLEERLNGKTYADGLREESKHYNILSNMKNKSLIDIEIERCQQTINRHKFIYEELTKKEYNEHYRKRITNIIRMINFNEKRIEKLTKINENDKNKEKYEKYLYYRRKKKSDFYNKKIKYKVEDLHWQIAKELAENYETIIIGKIDTRSILMQHGLSNSTNRVLQSLSHYSFREKLVYKCLTYDRNVIIQIERYTTKMCCICGNYDEKITGEKEIKCKKCGNKFDRDGGSAQNMYYGVLE